MEGQKQPSSFEEFMNSLKGEASSASPLTPPQNLPRPSNVQPPNNPNRTPAPVIQERQQQAPRPYTVPLPAPKPPQVTQQALPKADFASPQGKEYQSAIRTMQDDIARIKSGKDLSGGEIQKRIAEQYQRPQIVQSPPVQAKGGPVQAQTGQPSQAQGSPIKPAEPKGENKYTPGTGLSDEKGRIVAHERPPMSNEIPKPGILAGLLFKVRVNKRLVLILGAGLVVLGVGYLLMGVINREPEVALTTFTPRPSRTPVSAMNLDAHFKGISAYEFKTAVLTTQSLFETLEKQIVSKGQFLKFPITLSQSSKSLGLIEIFETLATAYPSDISDALGKDFSVLAYGQKEIFDSETGVAVASGSLNSLVLIAEVTDLSKINSVLSLWAPTIIKDLAPVLNINQKDITSSSLLQHNYKDITIRYANFKYPHKTVDFAVVPASNKKNYFIITNSRESMFSVIDRLRGN